MNNSFFVKFTADNIFIYSEENKWLYARISINNLNRAIESLKIWLRRFTLKWNYNFKIRYALIQIDYNIYLLIPNEIS